MVPDDFPHPGPRGAVAGVQDKVLLTNEFEDAARVRRWKRCEELVAHLAERSLQSKIGKRWKMSEVDILAQYLTRLQATGWVSDEEARWVLRRVAGELGWPVPPGAEEIKA